jgi:hypothetical protein
MTKIRSLIRRPSVLFSKKLSNALNNGQSKKRKSEYYKKISKIALLASLTVVGGILIYHHKPTKQILIALGSNVRCRISNFFNENSTPTLDLETSNKLPSKNHWGSVKSTFFVMAITLIIIKVGSQGEIVISMDSESTSSHIFWQDCWNTVYKYRPVVGALISWSGVVLLNTLAIPGVSLVAFGWFLATGK